MDILEAIRLRHSTRAFDGRPLTEADHKSIASFIEATAPPFGVHARIELIQADFGDERVKLGTYGSVKGARDFMGLIYGEGPLVQEGSAYWLEQVVLHCTSIGVGSIWLAGFTHSSFAKHVKLAPAETLGYACPVGYEGGQRPLAERIGLWNSKKLHAAKKPFETLFLDAEGQPLTPQAAGDWELPLQMTRIAPSAKNLQPYRVVVTPTACHFLIQPSMGIPSGPGWFSHIDVGIAMCHFEQTCLHQGIAGSFQVLDDAPTVPDRQYVISYVRS
ncbi:MAG: hypothetical protein LBR32_01230 [Propionibacteriaceae bacterium]|jgi:nitroreductase|nr:hypothetical protein [Propionibacteriaceae bacterium]